jgi:hypothetical protein
MPGIVDGSARRGGDEGAGGMTVFHRGDRVRWSSHGGEAVGVVVAKITADTHAAGRVVRATKDHPQYLVRSDNGGEAVHKPDALSRA